MVVKGEECGERIVREFGIYTYTLLCLKKITNEVVRYSTGTVQCYVAAQMEEEFRGEWIRVYV